MKNFALITYSGEGLPIALKLKEEGWVVKVGIIEDKKDILTSIEEFTEEEPQEKKRRLASYDGMLDKMTAKELVKFLKDIPEDERAEWFIFPDMNHCFKYAEQLMGLGFNGLFCTEEDRTFEVDRDMAKSFVDENYSRIDQNKVFEFTSADELEDFEPDEVYVLKGKDEDAPTVVPASEDPELAWEEIKASIEKHKDLYEKSGFILEVKISDAVEHTAQGVWNNGELIYFMNDIEAKPKGAGDIGKMTGCSADLTFTVEPNDEIVDIAFPEAVYQMAQEHEGVFVWDASLLISRRTNKIYFGEFCSNRLGYNCIYSELSNLPKVGDWFNGVCSGVNPYENKKKEFSGSIRIFNNEKEAEGGEVCSKKDIGIHYVGDSDFWPMDVKMDGDKMVTCGYSEDIAVITGQGDTITELAEDIYGRIRQFTLESRDWTYRSREDYTSQSYPTSMVSRFEFGNNFLYYLPPFSEDEDKQEKIEEIKERLEGLYTDKYTKSVDKIKKKVYNIING